MPLKFSTDTFGAYNTHNGYELARVFGLKLEIASGEDLAGLIGWGRSFPLARRVLAKRPFSWLAGQSFLAEPHFRYWPALCERARQGGYLQGYWQSERYFASHAAHIRTDFTFRDDLSGANLRIAHAISQRTAISVHVRRGDYVTNSKTLSVHGACSLEYYHAAIGTLLLRIPDAQLVAFSDDPQWVSEVLRPHYPRMILVDHNNGIESYNDMRLMSMCRHHVIANSSFSWWAAWLNASPDKIVISPKRWFADGRLNPDLIPDSWLKI